MYRAGCSDGWDRRRGCGASTGLGVWKKDPWGRGQDLVWPQCGLGICVIFGRSSFFGGFLWVPGSSSDGTPCPHTRRAGLGIKCNYLGERVRTGKTLCLFEGSLRHHGEKAGVAIQMCAGQGTRASAPVLVSQLVVAH